MNPMVQRHLWLISWAGMALHHGSTWAAYELSWVHKQSPGSVWFHSRLRGLGPIPDSRQPSRGTCIYHGIYIVISCNILGLSCNIILSGQLYNTIGAGHTLSGTGDMEQQELLPGITIVTAHLLASAPAYGYLRTDWSSVLNLIRDYSLWSYTAVERIISHRHSITAHLNWVCIFLGSSLSAVHPISSQMVYCTQTDVWLNWELLELFHGTRVAGCRTLHVPTLAYHYHSFGRLAI